MRRLLGRGDFWDTFGSKSTRCRVDFWQKWSKTTPLISNFIGGWQVIFGQNREKRLHRRFFLTSLTPRVLGVKRGQNSGSKAGGKFCAVQNFCTQLKQGKGVGFWGTNFWGTGLALVKRGIWDTKKGRKIRGKCPCKGISGGLRWS